MADITEKDRERARAVLTSLHQKPYPGSRGWDDAVEAIARALAEQRIERDRLWRRAVIHAANGDAERIHGIVAERIHGVVAEFNRLRPGYEPLPDIDATIRRGD